MSDKRPDVHKLRKKHRVDELVAALRYPDAMVRAEAATALGEIGNRESAASVKAFAAELIADATRAGHWDPGETSRLILKAWAAGAASNSDRELREYAAKVSVRLESQEAARREALLSGVRQMPPEIDEEIPVRPEREATPAAAAAGMAAARMVATERATTEMPAAGHGDTAPEQKATAAKVAGTAAVAAATEPAAPIEGAPIAVQKGPVSDSAAVAVGTAVEPGAGAEADEPEQEQTDAGGPEELDAPAAVSGLGAPERVVPAALFTLVGHQGEIAAIALAAGGSRAVSASWDGTMRVWDLDIGKSLRVLRGHEPGYLVVAASPDGRRVASGSADGTVRVWDLDTGKNIHTLRDHRGTVCAVAVTHDGRGVVSCSSDRTLRLWDMETGRSLRTFEGHEQAVESFTLPADGLRLISGSRDGTVRVWDLESGHALTKLAGHDGERLLAVSADGGIAATVDDDGTLRVWDLVTGGVTHTYEAGRSVWFSAAAVVRSGAQILLGCWGGHVMLFDPRSAEMMHFPEPHAADVNVVETSPDGSRAISGSADDTAVLWHLPTLRRLDVFEGHAGMITALAITPDGRRVVTGSSDTTLRVWELPPLDDTSASTESVATDSNV